ncbi:hypothetical protein BaRGS_00004383, partial [Batillaria attramentaria]
AVNTIHGRHTDQTWTPKGRIWPSLCLEVVTFVALCVVFGQIHARSLHFPAFNTKMRPSAHNRASSVWGRSKAASQTNTNNSIRAGLTLSSPAANKPTAPTTDSSPGFDSQALANANTPQYIFGWERQNGDRTYISRQGGGRHWVLTAEDDASLSNGPCE